MGLPSAPEARLYYQAAKQRLLDAQFLLAAGRTTGAMYLAGYCIECMMKASILSRLAKKKRAVMLASFRGAKAHDFDWLRARYFETGAAAFPARILKAFVFVNTWDVEIRYKAGTVRYRDAEDFLRLTEEIVAWADEGM